MLHAFLDPQDPGVIQETLQNAKDALARVNIETSNGVKPLEILGAVVPHASFLYSGQHAAMVGMVTMKGKKRAGIVWFKHNPQSKTEHSLANVLYLYRDFAGDVFHDYLDTETNLDELEPALFASADFAHLNGQQSPQVNLLTVAQNDAKLLYQDSSTYPYPRCGQKAVDLFLRWCAKNGFDTAVHMYSFSSREKGLQTWADDRIFRGVICLAHRVP